jgi:hypothetical protein
MSGPTPSVEAKRFYLKAAGHTLTLDRQTEMHKVLWSGRDDCSKRLIEVA